MHTSNERTKQERFAENQGATVVMNLAMYSTIFAVSSPTGLIHSAGRTNPYCTAAVRHGILWCVNIRTVPVSRRCTAKVYLIPARLYIQSTTFPGALSWEYVSIQRLAGEVEVHTCISLNRGFPSVKGQLVNYSACKNHGLPCMVLHEL